MGILRGWIGTAGDGNVIYDVSNLLGAFMLSSAPCTCILISLMLRMGLIIGALTFVEGWFGWPYSACLTCCWFFSSRFLATSLTYFGESMVTLLLSSDWQRKSWLERDLILCYKATGIGDEGLIDDAYKLLVLFDSSLSILKLCYFLVDLRLPVYYYWWPW